MKKIIIKDVGGGGGEQELFLLSIKENLKFGYLLH